MPELPDVQVYKETLDATALHRRIEDVDVDADGMLYDVTALALVRRLKGEELAESRRHGKHLFVRVGEDNGWLRLHFGMTGELDAWEKNEESAGDENVALRLDFDDGSHLAYRITRKFGEIGWVDDVDAFIEERELGPDPLDSGFGLREFRKVLEGRRGMIKTTLMTQEILAGLGNVYVDEILFQVGLHPEAATDELEDDTVKEIHRAMNRVIKAAVKARVDADEMPASFLLPHRTGDQHCPKCGQKLKRKAVGGRPTYFCPEDQQRER